MKLSSIVWSSQREPLKAAVGAAEKTTRKELAANPLIVGEEKVIPSITRVFRRNQNLYVTFDVYDAQPDPADSKKRRIKVSMSLFNGKGVKAFEVGPVDATQLASTRPETVPVQIQVPLKDSCARALYLPDQRGGSTGPEIRVPTSAAGNSIGRRRRCPTPAAAVSLCRLSPALPRCPARPHGRLAPARRCRDTYWAGFPDCHRRSRPPVPPRG